ncbi:MAG: hypothetical protein HGA25_03200 [Clostridiales bacterium]|nr:hypothetical protein [Clostridiales bacterium]
MRPDIDLKLPKGVVVKDPEAAVQAILNICRDAGIKGRMGSTNLAAVKCDVDGLTLGHWYKLFEALGPEVCNVIEVVKAQQPDQGKKNEHDS